MLFSATLRINARFRAKFATGGRSTPREIVSLSFFPEELPNFLPADALTAINIVEFPPDLHIGNREGGKIRPGMHDGLIGKGNGVPLRHNGTDYGKVADGRAAAKAFERIAPLFHRLFKKPAGTRTLFPHDQMRTDLRVILAAFESIESGKVVKF